MRLLIDMNLSPKWVAFLQTSEFEAVHWSDVGPGFALDTEIMDYAKSNDWIILTHDLDFGAILAATGGEAPSVMQIRADNLSIDTIGAVVVAALGATSAALASGSLVTVEPARTRVTILPIVGKM